MASAYIYMQLPESDEVVTLGRLDINRGIGAFVYSPTYVNHRGWVPDSIRYPLRGEFHEGITTNSGIPGFIRDAAPDGWGQRVLAKAAGSDLDAIGYLMKSTNHDRTGNLMVGTTKVPPRGVGQAGMANITSLEDFIAFADNIQSQFPRQIDVVARQALRQRSSLGGARPKCTLRRGEQLILAKPRDRHDDFDVPAMEYACMSFAQAKGLNVAKVELHRGSKSVLLVDRFDRIAQDGRFRRIPMLSALTLLDSDWQAPERNRWRYAAVADEMRRRQIPLSDLHELYKRMCFNALVGNDDDHPKNHAIIWQGNSWRLSPMYDVVPTLDGESPASLSMEVGSSGRRVTRENMLSHAKHFDLSIEQAESVLDEVAGWEAELTTHYQQHLAGDELMLASQAVGAFRLRE